MTGWATGLRLMHPDNREEASLYYESKTGATMHKRLKISAETHAKIKQEAKAKGMFIDEFVSHVLALYEKDKLFNQMFKECGK